MLGQGLQVSPRAVIKAVDMSIGNNLGKILIPFEILGQQPEVVRFVIFPTRFFVIFVVGD